jgi:hypothetical protein
MYLLDLAAKASYESNHFLPSDYGSPRTWDKLASFQKENEKNRIRHALHQIRIADKGFDDDSEALINDFLDALISGEIS